MMGAAPPGLRLALVVVVATVVQYGLLTHLRIAGVAPDLLLVIAIAGGFMAGEVRGAIGGFVSGLALDVLTWGRPFGLAVLVFTLVGWACGRVRSVSAVDARVAEVGGAVAASVLAVTTYVGAAALLGSGDVLSGSYLAVVGVVAVWSALLILPVSAVLRWVWGDPEDATAWAR